MASPFYCLNGPLIERANRTLKQLTGTRSSCAARLFLATSENRGSMVQATHSASITQRLLVTGASGHLGGRVIEFLLEMNAGSISATTRDPSKLAGLAARGVDVRAADFDKPDTLVAAFTEVDRLLLISTDAIFVPGQRVAQHKAAIEAAAKAGVKHIIYTSMISPKPSSESIVEDDHFWTEQAIASSPMS